MPILVSDWMHAAACRRGIRGARATLRRERPARLHPPLSPPAPTGARRAAHARPGPCRRLGHWTGQPMRGGPVPLAHTVLPSCRSGAAAQG